MEEFCFDLMRANQRGWEPELEHCRDCGVRTGGSFSALELTITPGSIVLPHTHSREDEVSFVIEGEIGARVGEQVVSAVAGSYVFKPRNVPHTFWNVGVWNARTLEIISPAGFAQIL